MDNEPINEEEEFLAEEEEDAYQVNNDMLFGEEENGEEEEEEEIAELPPDHPLFHTLQAQMKDQLQRQYDAVDVEIRDKIAQKNQLAENREQVGVELYQIQQTLGKLQTRLTETIELKQQYEQERLQKDEELVIHF